jgi:hypothetical protein
MTIRRTLTRLGPLGTALTVGQVAWAVRQHWLAIPVEHRGRLQELLRKSRGKPSNLSRSERRELRGLVKHLNLGRLVREGAMSASALRQIRRPS